MTAVLKLDPAVGGRRYRYGLSKRELSQTSGWLFISRDRAPCPPVLGRRPRGGQAINSLWDRRRNRALAASCNPGNESSSRRTRATWNVPWLWPRAGLRIPPQQNRAV